MLSKLSHFLKFRPVQEDRKKILDNFVENHCISFSGKYLATATKKSNKLWIFFVELFFCFRIFLAVEIKQVTN